MGIEDNMTESFTMPAEGPRRINVREWTLEVIAGPDKGRKASTLEGLLRVGSDPTSELVLSDGTVSRRHLEVERVAQGLLLRISTAATARGSTAGEILSAFVEPGDKIVLGKTKIQVKQASRGTQVTVDGGDSFGELTGQTQVMQTLFTELKALSKDDLPVLIEGETGTGKELAARAIHAHSMRRHAPFKVLDCAQVKPADAHNELFGAEGAFAAAGNGTLMLDEVSQLPAAVQPLLVRVLETKELPAPNGKTTPLLSRVIAATQSNLAQEAEADHFRKDLYFRLAVGRVRMPPLRARKADIGQLAKKLLAGLGATLDLQPQTLHLLEGYDWPGNVRELRNVLERGTLLQRTGTASWLELLISPSKKTEAPQSAMQLAASLPYHEARDRVMGDFERYYFAEVLKRCGYDIKEAEARTGLSMQSLYRLFKKNGLKVKDLKNAEGLA